MIKAIALLLPLALLVSGSPAAQAPDRYDELKQRAEALYGEGSFARAHELYQRASTLELSPGAQRWVAFRLADCDWRAAAGTRQSDPSRLEAARDELLQQVALGERTGEKSEVWALAQRSLGDWYWVRRDANDWGNGWSHYREALDWWAGSRELDRARDRYLETVWRMAGPCFQHGWFRAVLPRQVLENALTVAVTPEDRAQASFLLALTLRQSSSDWSSLERGPKLLRDALEMGRENPWYDDALYSLAEWLGERGRPVALPDGGFGTQPDYVEAAAVLRRFLSEFEKGETAYHDRARSMLERICGPQVGIAAAQAFLPDSPVQVRLSWRNLERVSLSLVPIDLGRDVELGGDRGSVYDWLASIDVGGRAAVREWTVETGDTGEHEPGSRDLRLEGAVEPGAYLIEARGGGLRARDLLLVTDQALVLKAVGSRALAWVCDAGSGEPIAGARVALWERSYERGKRRWRKEVGRTGEDGLADFDLGTRPGTRQLLACAILADRQSLCISGSDGPQAPAEGWRIYACAEKPAYRPMEEARWKLVVRRREGGGAYRTPAGRSLYWQLADSRGAEVASGEAELNAFGSAWSRLELGREWPLGEYSIRFWEDRARKHDIGSETLFRLEEYKLPEFRVSVATPEDPAGSGRRKSFKVGETVEVEVSAEYTFGGPVAGARVQGIVYQQPFFPSHTRQREFPWFHEESASMPWHWGGRSEVHRSELVTDALGRARFSFPTPAGASQDFEYSIEARVTDASRREVAGTGRVRAARQRYYVWPEPSRNLVAPGEKVRVDFHAADANQQPMEVEGQVIVTRRTWREVWRTPRGERIERRELDRRRRLDPALAVDREWRLISRGYDTEEVLRRVASTDETGRAELELSLPREGYYDVLWSGRDRDGAPVEGRTRIFAASENSTRLGYHHGGVELILDRDTLEAGEEAVLMISVPASGRHVLFSVEAEELMHHRVYGIEGTVKLVRLPLSEDHIPNVHLSAIMVADGGVWMDTREIVVPPVKQFLEVEVSADREEYQPRQEGELTVSCRDRDGLPVQAELSLALVDESVFAIQEPYAADPRRFFYGEKRPHRARNDNSFGIKPLTRLVEGEDGKLRSAGVAGDADELDLAFAPEEEEHAQGDSFFLGAAEGGKRGRAGADLRLGEEVRSRLSSLGYAADRSEAGGAPRPPGSAGPGGPATGGEGPAVVVRSDFRSAVLWLPDLVTDADGTAVVPVTWPDSLTRWRATARAATTESRFGAGQATARTKMPVIARLQAPRFFVVGDELVLSAVVVNNTSEALQGSARIALEGDSLRLLDEAETVLDLAAAGGEQRADWRVRVLRPGEVVVRVEARAGEHGDAELRRYPAFERGIERFLVKAGKTDGGELEVRMDLPRERRPESERLVVQLSPSLAVTLLDALPYLVDYPYGCVEQTLSRFVPAVVVAGTLGELGLTREEVLSRAFGGIEPGHAEETHERDPEGLRQLNDVVEKSLARLYDFQHSDGGWAWWKHGDSDHFMTAYTVWGLALAREAGIEVRADALERSLAYLELEIVEEEREPDLQAWMLHALAVGRSRAERGHPDQAEVTARENLWEKRGELNAYSRALFALAVHAHPGQEERARVLVENLANGVEIDRTPDTSIVQRGQQESHAAVIPTAHWGQDGIFRRWSEGGVEATAFCLRALVAIAPDHELVESTMNWLVKNRRGGSWSNTRDTAICVLALSDYLKASGELEADLAYELSVNGSTVAERRIAPADVLSAPSRFEIDRRLLRDGENRIAIARRSGSGPLYFSVQMAYFSRERPIPPAGNEVFVRRDYYRLAPAPTLLKGYVQERQRLVDGSRIASGERVEVVLTIEAKNELSYMVFEDLKPAGLEAARVRSGEALSARRLKSRTLDEHLSEGDGVPEGDDGLRPRRLVGGPPADRYAGPSRRVHQELRDRKVALFLDELGQGVWEIRYELRAEVPGRFAALPVMGHAMYVPEIRCNGGEISIEVVD